MDVVLVMLHAGTRRDFRLKEGETTIGRRPDCDLCVRTADVSRQHCKVTVEADAVTIEDLESANGTLVNGHQIREIGLSAGDQVKVGPAVFVVQIDGVPANPTAGVMADDDIDDDAGSDEVTVVSNVAAPPKAVPAEPDPAPKPAATSPPPTPATATPAAAAAIDDDDDDIDLDLDLDDDDDDDIPAIELTEEDLFAKDDDDGSLSAMDLILEDDDDDDDVPPPRSLTTKKK